MELSKSLNLRPAPTQAMPSAAVTTCPAVERRSSVRVYMAIRTPIQKNKGLKRALCLCIGWLVNCGLLRVLVIFKA